eukprot:scaffold3722_cov263-Pinguiococcus_pyrenoidosus.AAC.13
MLVIVKHTKISTESTREPPTHTYVAERRSSLLSNSTARASDHHDAPAARLPRRLVAAGALSPVSQVPVQRRGRVAGSADCKNICCVGRSVRCLRNPAAAWRCTGSARASGCMTIRLCWPRPARPICCCP